MVVLLLLRSSKDKNIKKITGIVTQNAMALVFLTSLASTLGSLFLSDIAGFEPCHLCWYQRGFMYPIALIAGVALYFGENIHKYIISLGIVGFAISIYHVFIQIQPQLSPCSTASVDCSVKQFEYFGYISIPVMSASAFLLIILFSLSTILQKRS